MKKISEIAFAIVLFFAFGASMSTATTNIDAVDHYAKMLLDGSYIDFGCPIIFPTIVSMNTSTAAVATPAASSRAQFSIQQNPSISGPSVASVSASVIKITDELAGNRFSLTVTFTNPMDTNVAPTIVLAPDLVATGTLSFSDTEWSSDAQTYTVNYDVFDRNEDYSSVSATVIGGVTRDILSVPVQSFAAHDLFAVRMSGSLNSQSSSTEISTSALNSSHCSTIIVSDYMISGTANGTNSGDIVMDPIGGGVFNDAHGNLSGYAWGSHAGWVNFNPVGGGVTIDADGFFHGLAWSQNLGWISFNCDATGSCATDPYRVRTLWRPGMASSVVTTPTPGPSSSSTTTATPPTPSPTSAPIFTPTPSPTGPSPVPVTPGTPSPSPESSTTSSPSPTTPATPSTATPVPSTSPAPSSVVSGSPTTVPATTSNASESRIEPSLGDRIMGVIFRGFERLAVILNTVRGNIAFKTIALAAAAGALLSTPTSVWRSVLSATAFRKRKPWGTVYDSVTKQPLDPAYVVLKDENGNEINTSITDLDGRYGFLTDAGRFTIVANKTNYTFPSARLAGRSGDELYSDLYFGGAIDVLAKGDVITKNIPMDPMTTDWNERAKQEQKLLKFYSKRELVIARIMNVLFWFGFALSAFALIVAPKPINIGIIALYLVVFVLKETVLHPKKQGMITDQYGNPMSFALMRIFSANLNTEIAHKAANALGQYFALVPNGNYYVKIEKKNPDGSYTSAYTSEPFEVKKGVINNDFKI